MPAKSLMIVAGERSGDIYGAALASSLRARRSELEVFGCGGEAMREAGVETVVDAHQVSMIGLTEVVAGLPRAWRALRHLEAEAARRRPQVAVLIDFPDFNLRLARRLKKHAIRIVYFVSPQIWAWRQGRLKQLKASIAKMICIFDFEEEIYRKAGIPVEYVGHPLVDLTRPRLDRGEFFAEAGLDPATTTVGLLPGSRRSEVAHNLPTMLDAASRLALTRPIQFVLAAAPTIESQWLESLTARSYVGRASVRTLRGATHDVLDHADLAVVASGTATIEAALCERPLVVVYRVSPFTAWMARRMIKVPFYSMVNLLAGRSVVPELLQDDFTALNLSRQIEFLLDHPQAQEEMIRGLHAVRSKLGSGGAIARAADAIINEFEPAGASPHTA